MEKCLQVKVYEKRIEEDVDKEKFYILSFGKDNHVKVTKRAMEIIELMDGTRSFNRILYDLSKKNIQINKEELEYFIKKFIEPKCLLEGSKEYKREKKANKLWIHIPIIESSKFSFIYKMMKHLINKRLSIILLFMVSICCINAGYILIKNNNIFDQINSLQIICLVYFSMFVHELGHATAAHKYGVDVGKIGFGIYMFYLIFFVDMTNTWRLDRTKRIINDVSGMYFQLLMIIPVYVFAVILNDFSLFLGIIIIFISSLMNIVPVLRMDGYWLLSDYLNIQNVQIKAKESILKLYKEMKKKHRHKQEGKVYTIAKSKYIYGLYSLAYSTVTIILIIFVIYASLTLVANWEDLIDKTAKIYLNLLRGNIAESMLLMNNILILLLPVISILGCIISIIRECFYKYKKEGTYK